MCKTIEYGLYNEKAYHIQEWIDGIDLRDVIENLSEDLQYKLGVKSGIILSQIHTIKALITLKNEMIGI